MNGQKKRVLYHINDRADIRNDCQPYFFVLIFWEM